MDVYFPCIAAYNHGIANPAVLMEIGMGFKTKETTIRGRLLERIIKDVDTGCWVWTGHAIRPNRNASHCYGVISIWNPETKRGRAETTHRLSYREFVGEIPAGMCVMHKCDNPRCINPEHLAIGTQTQNMADMYAKGRNGASRGENHSQTKITIAQVKAIRADYAVGATQSSLAAKYGLSKCNVWNIVNFKSWKNVNDSSYKFSAKRAAKKITVARKRGSEHPQSKLGEIEVLKLRDLYASGRFTLKELSKQFGIGLTQTQRIVTRQSWGHI